MYIHPYTHSLSNLLLSTNASFDISSHRYPIQHQYSTLSRVYTDLSLLSVTFFSKYILLTKILENLCRNLEQNEPAPPATLKSHDSTDRDIKPDFITDEMIFSTSTDLRIRVLHAVAEMRRNQEQLEEALKEYNRLCMRSVGIGRKLSPEARWERRNLNREIGEIGKMAVEIAKRLKVVLDTP